MSGHKKSALSALITHTRFHITFTSKHNKTQFHLHIFLTQMIHISSLNAIIFGTTDFTSWLGMFL